MAYEHWSLGDIAFDKIDTTKVTPALLEVVKAAALVEFGHIVRHTADGSLIGHSGSSGRARRRAGR